MPIYEYQCVDCQDRDERVAGIDDRFATCVQCGGLMWRLDEEIFEPYYSSEANRTLSILHHFYERVKEAFQAQPHFSLTDLYEIVREALAEFKDLVREEGSNP